MSSEAKMSEALVWVNGKPSQTVSVFDRGFAYGDGLFETIRIAQGRLTLAALHWDRLNRGCHRLRIPLDLGQLQQEVTAFLRTCQQGVLKITISRGVGGRGYNPEGLNQPSRILSFHPLPEYSFDPADQGVCVKLCQTRLGYSALAGVKHLNRLEQVLARSEWQGAEFGEGLLCDMDGRLIEGVMSNLFVVNSKNELITPDLSRCGVEGVCRQYVLSKALDMGYTVRVMDVSPVLEDVAELFLCNSVNGIWPIVAVNEREWKIGSVTRNIQRVVWDVLND